jgi:hypothetical protein
MDYTVSIIIFAVIVATIIVAVVRARKMNKEQSALTMHPDNFRKADIEQVETRPRTEKNGKSNSQ